MGVFWASLRRRGQRRGEGGVLRAPGEERSGGRATLIPGGGRALTPELLERAGQLEGRDRRPGAGPDRSDRRPCRARRRRRGGCWGSCTGARTRSSRVPCARSSATGQPPCRCPSGCLLPAGSVRVAHFDIDAPGAPTWSVDDPQVLTARASLHLNRERAYSAGGVHDRQAVRALPVLRRHHRRHSGRLTDASERFEMST